MTKDFLNQQNKPFAVKHLLKTSFLLLYPILFHCVSLEVFCALPQILKEGTRTVCSSPYSQILSGVVCTAPLLSDTPELAFGAHCSQTSDPALHSELMLCTFLNVHSLSQFWSFWVGRFFLKVPTGVPTHLRFWSFWRFDVINHFLFKKFHLLCWNIPGFPSLWPFVLSSWALSHSTQFLWVTSFKFLPPKKKEKKDQSSSTLPGTDISSVFCSSCPLFCPSAPSALLDLLSARPFFSLKPI